MTRTAFVVLLSSLLLAACAGVVTSQPTATSAVLFLPRCTSSVRPQADLDFAGLPPLVVSGPTVKCLLNASNGGSAYDAGYDASIQLTDGRVLHLYERRGGLPTKSGGQTPQREGTRDVRGASWTWAILQGPTLSLTNTVNGTYVELDLPADESQLDALAAIAVDLRPVETLPRPAARDICAALPVSSNPITVAGAFDSTADAVARWLETPQTPDGPHDVNSEWRRHPSTEPVAVCYLDGDFGPAKHPPLPSGATEFPNWTRVVYLVGVDRHPIGRLFGWQDRIPIVDPGR
jgi:hypothetical protein